MTDSNLYRGYDQTALDAQYNNRAMVPEFESIYAVNNRRSEKLLEAFEHRFDVAYGASDRERLDIIVPSGDGPFPVNVFFHGGYWMSRTKSDVTFAARAMVEAGAVVVLAEYTLVPDVTLAELIDQCREAVAWAHANATDLNADPDRLFVSGHSAGGHITAMLTATDWPAFCGGPADLVKGGCSLSGLFDLEPIRLCYLNDTLGLSETEARDMSPVHLTPAGRAPLILAVGGAESDEYHRQGESLAEAWKSTGIECQIMLREGKNHFTIVPDFADPGSDLAEAVRRQMGLGG